MQKKNNKETMKRVLKYIRKYTPALVLSLLLAGLTVLLTLYIPILTGNAVDLIIGKGQVDMAGIFAICLLYTSPSPRDVEESRMPSSA